MSTRYEWFDAASTHVAYVPPMHDVHTGEHVGEEADEFTAEQGAIVLSGDEATVLHGTPEALRNLAQRILRAIPGPELPSLPPTPEVDEYGQVLCPWTDGDEVCGEPVNVWDKDPVRRDLLLRDGAFVAGPSSLSENAGGDEEVQCNNLHEWAVPAIDEWR